MEAHWIPFWRPSISVYGHHVDLLFLGLSVASAAILLLLTILLLGFAIRYRAGSDADRSDRIRKSWRFEVAWTAATFVAFLLLFVWGAALFQHLYAVPDDALPIYVVAQQWMWKVQHPEGQQEIDELHVPLGRPVRLIMASQDVIHSFFVPALRLKRDVVPGRWQQIWFRPERTGAFDLFCAEYCGTDHARMAGTVFVLAERDYARWLAAQPSGEPLAGEGAALFRSLGCSGCHEGRGAVRAPQLRGLYGRPVPLADGRVVTADERYLRDSILLPHSEVAAGYEPKMPSFAGQVSEADLIRLVAYIKSLAP